MNAGAADAMASAATPNGTQSRATPLAASTLGQKARLMRAPHQRCGGTLSDAVTDGPTALEGMVEALFAESDVAYTDDGRLVVVGNTTYSEVAPTTVVSSCTKEFSGGDVSSPSAFDADRYVPVSPRAWQQAKHGKAPATLGVRAFALPLTAPPVAAWRDRAEALVLLWAELTYDEMQHRSSGFLAIVGRYGREIRVLALSPGLALRPSDDGMELRVIAGTSYFISVPHPDSGLTRPGDDAAWMRGMETSSWIAMFAWRDGSLAFAGVVPTSLRPDATLRKSAQWQLDMASATYEATATGLIGHEVWRPMPPREPLVHDREYVLSARNPKSPWEATLRPKTYAPPP
jgi:hypothetical protein